MDTNIRGSVEKKPYSRWVSASIICFIAGIAFWIPNLVFEYGYSFWLLTFIINPLGVLFGYIGKSKFGIISNIIMTFSFFMIMFGGYLIGSYFS